jgi:hypothetical protein
VPLGDHPHPRDCGGGGLAKLALRSARAHVAAELHEVAAGAELAVARPIPAGALAPTFSAVRIEVSASRYQLRKAGLDFDKMRLM